VVYFNGLAIEAADLRKTYMLGKVPIEAIRGLDLRIPYGDFAAILGPSGCGKSTLLNLLGALDRPTNGRLRIDGFDMIEAKANRLVEMRRRHGFVFQFFNLVPRLTAQENVELGMNIDGLDRTTRRKRAEELLRFVGLEDRAAHRPAELSGGQQQRVAIARALANRPTFLFMDEPTGNLDSQNARDIIALIKSLNADNRLTTIVVTHDQNVAQQAKHTYHMLDGAIEDGGAR
jgi:ABC-type lipoprotein export system ATPase subunit